MKNFTIQDVIDNPEKFEYKGFDIVLAKKSNYFDLNIVYLDQDDYDYISCYAKLEKLTRKKEVDWEKVYNITGILNELSDKIFNLKEQHHINNFKSMLKELKQETEEL